MVSVPVTIDVDVAIKLWKSINVSSLKKFYDEDELRKFKIYQEQQDAEHVLQKTKANGETVTIVSVQHPQTGFVVAVPIEAIKVTAPRDFYKRGEQK